MTTLRYGKRIRFGTWNVRTLYQTGKLAQVCRILQTFKLAFLGLSEVRWNEFGELTTSKGHQWLWSGMPNKTDPHQRGVGVLINKEYRKFLLEQKFISERIILVRFKGQARNITIVQCYAPTEDANDGDKQAFYDQLNRTLAEIPHSDLKLLMGDFNAIVGDDNRDIEHVMGKHGVGTMNENGELFAELCGLNELKIGGTLFPHRRVHKVTWNSPDSRTQNQIDHICISAKWSNILQDVRVRRGADIASDHHLLVGDICLRMKCVPRPNRPARTRYRINRLKNPQHRTAFVNDLRQRLAETTVDNDIQHCWNTFKDAVNKSCDTQLGKVTRTKDEDFISSDTWKLIGERQDLKNKINATRPLEERKRLQRTYNALDKCIRRAIREDKRNHVDAMASAAESAAAVHNMKELYDITKKIAGVKAHRSMPVKNTDGQLLTTIDEQLTRWRDHFQEVLNLERDGIIITRIENPDPIPVRTAPPSRTEVTDAIKAMKNGKAAGVDSIPAEVLKADASLTALHLHPLIVQIWEQESYPSDWMRGLIVKLPKKGDLTDCNNWRGITILCVCLKIVMRIILQRMVKHIDPKLRPEQAGFREGRSCIDQINTLRIIIEQAVEFRSPLYLLFVDYEKAFDSINRNCIWNELRNSGVPTKIVSLIEKSYNAFECSVLHDGMASTPFNTISGVRQGCLLSPLLFLIVMDAVVKRATDGRPRGIVWNPMQPNQRLESLDYADDKCELSHRFCDQQAKVDDLSQESAKVGLKINVAKTKELRINVDSSVAPLSIDSQLIERVEHFQYLGSIIDENGGAIKDVETRIRKARGAYTILGKIWQASNYTVNTKLHIFKSCVVSVLLYGCETWLVSEVIRRKLQVFINRCLRRILRIFWPNTISNDALWERANMADINNIIRRRKYGWIGHTLRKPPEEICHRALQYNPQGSRPVGRPKNTWRRTVLSEVNSLQEFSSSRVTNITSLKPIADRRARWRNLVSSLCPS